MTLHILNGDDTLTGFNETGLDGDVLVWREVFSQGPLTSNMDAAFWKAREAWIVQTFDDAPGRYQDMVIQELEKLNGPYDEINLWFEFDLHCQVNLLGVMQLLQQQTDLSERAVYLICPDSHPDIADFRGMGQLNGDRLEDVFDNRVQLTEYDFTLATEAWQHYVTFNATHLQQWLDAVPFWGSLHSLQHALQAQVKRLQVNEQGLNYIEQILLQLYQSGITQPTAIHQAFWNHHKIYGMGDAELNIYLNALNNKGLIALA